MDTKKHILTIFWSTIAPMVEEWLPEHDTFNNTYFCEVIILRIINAVFPYQRRRREQRVYIHIDNARPHNSKRSVHHIHQILNRVTFLFLALWKNAWSRDVYSRGEATDPSDDILRKFVSTRFWVMKQTRIRTQRHGSSHCPWVFLRT
jgi:hypothetical protein